MTTARQNMRNSVTKAGLSEPRRRLVEMMQQISFGRIDCLAVRGGEPVFDPKPRVIRDIKLGGENSPGLESGHRDFLLKTQVIELLDYLTEVNDGIVESIEVKHGLPFRLIVEHTV
jgi:hypothetical protein